jgi:hypothetical protein
MTSLRVNAIFPQSDALALYSVIIGLEYIFSILFSSCGHTKHNPLLAFISLQSGLPAITKFPSYESWLR